MIKLKWCRLMQSIAVAVDMNTDESTFTIPTMLQVRSGGTTILGGGGGDRQKMSSGFCCAAFG